MNQDIDKLQPYPFEKLMALKLGCMPPEQLKHIALSIGEPKHEPPAFVLEELAKHLCLLDKYPITKGLPELRQAIVRWVTTRFRLTPNTLDAETQVIPVAGTREALFSFVQASIDTQLSARAKVICPNPFYQIYEGAALLAGAEPIFLNCTADNNFLPDFDAVTQETWDACQILFICSPGNPTGATMDLPGYEKVLTLADKHKFVIASDECYSELYFDEHTPPLGLLEACQKLGRDDFRRCVVFHSLSKRSNLPGLRSGFVAGDAHYLGPFLKYRTYHGCALPVPTQMASIAAWQDEAHVKLNRDLYRQKFDAVLQILAGLLEVAKPDAGFYLWAKTPNSDTEFARELFDQQHVTVLPGSFLARDTQAGNPGQHYVRMALVAPVDECIEAAERIKTYLLAKAC